MPTESTFILAGLFVVAAAAGWAFARYFGGDDRDNLQPISEDYLRGLNLVLNQQTDEALEFFVEMAAVDDQTLETHFALGHLFRRRGEVDKAIRVHQNLLARPSLSEEQRDQAMLALGKDYLGAGLFDRAEKVFSELSAGSAEEESALEHVVGIYEQQSEWTKAIDARQRLDKLRGNPAEDLVGQYYCELAEAARQNGDLASARSYLKLAMSRGRPTVRSALIRAAIAREEGEEKLAIRLYQQALTQESDLVAEVLPLLHQSHIADGSEAAFERFLKKLLSERPELRPSVAYAAITHDLLLPGVLFESVEQFLLEDPTLNTLLSPHERDESGQIHDGAVRRIAAGLKALAEKSARYRCTQCGYATRRLGWHCPSCKRWETIRPIAQHQFEQLITA